MNQEERLVKSQMWFISPIQKTKQPKVIFEKKKWYHTLMVTTNSIFLSPKCEEGNSGDPTSVRKLKAMIRLQRQDFMQNTTAMA